jgi:hypothetical protein
MGTTNISFGVARHKEEGIAYPILLNGMEIGVYYPEPDGYTAVNAEGLEYALKNAIQHQFGINSKFNLFEVL